MLSAEGERETEVHATRRVVPVSSQTEEERSERCWGRGLTLPRPPGTARSGRLTHAHAQGSATRGRTWAARVTRSPT